MKPITPTQAQKSKFTSIPDAVIQAVNELITEKISLDGSARVLQKEIVTRACKIDTTLTSNKLYNNNHLDIEPLFRKAGWRVVYDKPAYNETYDAFFVFSKRHSKVS